MEQLTCPNCNVDVGREELKQNNLHCPTCGFDLSETEDLTGLNEVEDKDSLDDEKEPEKDEEEDEEEDE